jgi:vacuolar-type H+-ATPase subunit E/Vma4
MPEDIKGIIEKIQREGVDKAKESARIIEEDARKAASSIVEKAEKAAQEIIQKAREDARQTKEAAGVSLSQAGRDFLISLRSQTTAILNKIIVSSVSNTLTPEEMAKIIGLLIKEAAHKHSSEGVEVCFSKTDLAKIREGFLAKLSSEVRKGITLTPSDSISAGFTISFDSGKSHFDFSDKALAEYLSAYLNKELADIFNPK